MYDRVGVLVCGGLTRSEMQFQEWLQGIWSCLLTVS